MQNDLLRLKSFDWNNENSLLTLSNGRLNKKSNGELETVKEAIDRICETAAFYTKDPTLYERKFKEYAYLNMLNFSTPVWANMGFDNPNSPVACYVMGVEDTTYSITSAVPEMAALAKHGGGLGIHINNIRGFGSPISAGGVSHGVQPWMDLYATTIDGVSQGGVRRGNGAIYIDIDHPDFEEQFIRYRRTRDEIDLGVNISDNFIERCKNGDKEARKRYEMLLVERMQQGEPYIVFIDRVNDARPQIYKDLNLMVQGSNLCSEITLHTSSKYTGVCVLSSLNLALYDLWKGSDLPEVAIVFLNAVNDHFIDKMENVEGFEKAVAYAKKFRSLGLGVLGWHTLLQKKMIPFESFDAMRLNNQVFREIKESALLGANNNAHFLAIAPTRGNAQTANTSRSCEPWKANLFLAKENGNEFLMKNEELDKLIKSKFPNNPSKVSSIWDEIEMNHGSIQGLEYFSELEKKVFKTFAEIDQRAVLAQAEQRAKYICQSASTNLQFPVNADWEYISAVHWYAMTECKYLKTIYYCHSSATIKAGLDLKDCVSCEG